MNAYSIVILILGTAFWVFRIIVCLHVTSGDEFIIVPQNFVAEVVLLFITLACLVLFIKRSMIGAIIYLVSYLLYFGAEFYMAISGEGGNSTTMFMAVVGVSIPFLAFLDIALNTNKKNSSRRFKKTDWFYKDTEAERKKEDWEDENQYRL